MTTGLMMPWAEQACLPGDLQAAWSVRHVVYCLPDGARAPLMEHPAGADANGPHDAADLLPGTEHFVVYLQAHGLAVPEVVGSMRVLPNMHQASQFWDGFPARVAEVAREASRVAMHPEHRGNAAALYALLGCAVESSIAAGDTIWVGSLRRIMLTSLLRLGIHVEVLNDLQPVFYGEIEGVHQPRSGEPLFMCIIDLEKVRAGLYAVTEPVRNCGVRPFPLMFAQHAAEGWRPHPGEVAWGEQLRDETAALLPRVPILRR